MSPPKESTASNKAKENNVSPTVPPLASTPAYQGKAKRTGGTPGQRRPDSSSEEEEQDEQEGDESPSPEISESEDEPEEASAPKELPKEAATSSEERKEAPNFKSSYVIDSDHDSDVEEIETAEERNRRTHPDATAENMPKHSTPEQRQGWPKEWSHEWKRLASEEAAADRATQNNKRFNKHYKSAVEKARTILEYDSTFTWICGEEAGKNISRQFRKLWAKYSIDKMGSPESQQRDPYGADVSTPELRLQAWTNRVQEIGNARDILKDVNKFGFFHDPPKQ